MGSTLIRQAKPNESSILSELAFASKAYWGYNQEFMRVAQEELIISPNMIKESDVFIYKQNNKIRGFYLLTTKKNTANLNYLFVSPNTIRSGIGSKLWEHAVATARQHGCNEILIDSDPYAEGFYISMGAIKIGETSSKSIPGRVLPLLKFVIV